MQLSLHKSLDPETHLRIGRALAPLREEGVLIVGSGMSYHNLGMMFSPRGDTAATAFDAWLGEAIRDPATREQKLRDWRAAPGGREAHPREEHLLPLMVAAGAADGDRGVRSFGETIIASQSLDFSSVRFKATPRWQLLTSSIRSDRHPPI